MNIQPRGLRNNNPLNIRHSASKWQGARSEQTDKSFVQFTSMAYGYRAAWKVLESYWRHLHNKGMPFTPYNIIHRWAPPTENDTNAYVRTVCSISRLTSNEPLPQPSKACLTGEVDKLILLIMAMTTMECGIRTKDINTEDIKEGYEKAFTY
ncbi:MAG: structural protein P5 [Bacteroidaceae bacterium]|nr:structural protein P5 [Bacteroidaceae bacterium]MBQ5912032.1 structural protein P5 [Bacteroidaceae bacterium]